MGQYRPRGPTGTARLVLESLNDLGIAPQTLLDIAAGIGVLHHELLGRRVLHAVHLEAAAAYVTAAREEAERRVHGDRVHFRHGDFVALASELGSADLVTLDRVVCCYPEVEPLISLSAEKAERYYVLSFSPGHPDRGFGAGGRLPGSAILPHARLGRAGVQTASGRLDLLVYAGRLRPTMDDGLKDHWEGIYRARAPTEVSWYQPEARLSLELIRRVAPDLELPVVDVGGGASTLVDGLVHAGYQAVTVLDLAPTALAVARQRLGTAAAGVTWLEADVLRATLSSGAYVVWHDRAVFHFLTDPSDRRRYVAQTRRAVRPGGYVIVASFGPNGPTRCSGLPVQRYSPTAMHAEFGADFRMLDSVREDHRTPAGVTQAFVYCLCRIE